MEVNVICLYVTEFDPHLCPFLGVLYDVYSRQKISWARRVSGWEHLSFYTFSFSTNMMRVILNSEHHHGGQILFSCVSVLASTLPPFKAAARCSVSKTLDPNVSEGNESPAGRGSPFPAVCHCQAVTLMRLVHVFVLWGRKQGLM